MVAAKFNPRRLFWPCDIGVNTKVQKSRIVSRTQPFMERVAFFLRLILAPIRLQWLVEMSGEINISFQITKELAAKDELTCVG